MTNQINELFQTDITPMLEAGLGVDIERKTEITEIKDVSYPVKKDIWDNWFTFAYVAFKRLNNKLTKENKKIRSFAAIGTGQGADGLGALYAFPDLEKIILTDIDKRVIGTAQKNVEKYAFEKNVDVEAIAGNLCKPLKKKGIADVIYENLPNISEAGLVIDRYRTSSVFSVNDINAGNKKIKDFLLESHYASLIDAKDSLNEGGSLILSIGGRVPYELFPQMVEGAGYKFDELVAGFKLQTEPWEVLPGYAKAEKKGNIEFDFYDYDKAIQLLEKEGMKDPYIDKNGQELKKIIEPARITAQQAYELYKVNHDVKIGHTVHMLRAIKE